MGGSATRWLPFFKWQRPKELSACSLLCLAGPKLARSIKLRPGGRGSSRFILLRDKIHKLRQQMPVFSGSARHTIILYIGAFTVYAHTHIHTHIHTTVGSLMMRAENGHPHTHTYTNTRETERETAIKLFLSTLNLEPSVLRAYISASSIEK